MPTSDFWSGLVGGCLIVMIGPPISLWCGYHGTAVGIPFPVIAIGLMAVPVGIVAAAWWTARRISSGQSHARS